MSGIEVATGQLVSQCGLVTATVSPIKHHTGIDCDGCGKKMEPADFVHGTGKLFCVECSEKPEDDGRIQQLEAALVEIEAIATDYKKNPDAVWHRIAQIAEIAREALK